MASRGDRGGAEAAAAGGEADACAEDCAVASVAKCLLLLPPAAVAALLIAGSAARCVIVPRWLSALLTRSMAGWEAVCRAMEAQGPMSDNEASSATQERAGGCGEEDDQGARGRMCRASILSEARSLQPGVNSSFLWYQLHQHSENTQQTEYYYHISAGRGWTSHGKKLSAPVPLLVLPAAWSLCFSYVLLRSPARWGSSTHSDADVSALQQIHSPTRQTHAKEPTMSAQPKQAKRGRASKQGGKQQQHVEQPEETDAPAVAAEADGSSASASSSAAPPQHAPADAVVSSVQVTDRPLPTSRRQSLSNPSAAPFVVSPSSPTGAAPGVPVLFAPADLQGFGAETQFVGSIDQGTSSTRFILFDHAGRIVRSAQVEIEQLHPSAESGDAQQDVSGWTEHDPMEIMRSIYSCIDAVCNAGPRPILPAQIVALGLTNQRETSVVWDAHTGQPLHNAIVWHDARTAGIVAEMAARLSETGGKDHFRASCGLPLSTYFSATKIKWMMDNVPAVKEAASNQRARAGTIDSWIIWNLTSGGEQLPVFVTDVTNASRTMLMDLRSLRWHEDNCREFGIPLAMLPEIRSSSEVYGTVAQGTLKGVRIAGCVGDQQAAMIGQLCLKPGQAKNTYGTG